jgi:hypothetical protein
MRRRALWAAGSVQSERRAKFLSWVARAFTGYSIPSDRPGGNAEVDRSERQSIGDARATRRHLQGKRVLSL